ncbi:MAG: helix-turn-helix domain containing protein [Boseongicola sp. SB0667_bin_21]|nr:helix-turn-helix domain containing protein [Boseongicola sp. SB0667_bin_21]
MSTSSRIRTLEAAGLVHPRVDAVSAELFDGRSKFFLPHDKVQVKYEMLRAHFVDRRSASAAAEHHGYSRAAFYLVVAAFEDRGMQGLLDARRGRRGPLKLTPQIADFIAEAGPEVSSAHLAEQVERQFSVRLHRRTVERARR